MRPSAWLLILLINILNQFADIKTKENQNVTIGMIFYKHFSDEHSTIIAHVNDISLKAYKLFFPVITAKKFQLISENETGLQPKCFVLGRMREGKNTRGQR